ncbi:hypothetical protein HYG93_18280 [Acinetobacter sp. SwsAc6]|nr:MULTISPECIES: hypothetical protein [Acinetobacter]NWK76157.1 hypothetical protein [Acinetobacter sp. SwsAc6]
MKKALICVVSVLMLSMATNVSANSNTEQSNEVANCQNGFDSVDVCKLLS